MFYQLTVPGPIEDVEETRVLEWHCQEGARIAAGDLIVELETHKAVLEVRSQQAGMVRRILCQPGEWQKLGAPIALFSDTGAETEAEGPIEELPLWPFDYQVT